MALVPVRSRSASPSGAGSASRRRPVDPDALARLEALAPTLAATVSGVGAGNASGVLAAERVVPVHPALADLLPQGLMRGSAVACTGSAATSAAWLMVAEASRRGAWVGVAGLPGLGVQAAVEAGVEVARLVAVRERSDRPGAGAGDGAGYDDGTWGQVLAAMIDGFDLVVAGPAVVVRQGTARRVQARAQARGAVLVLVGDVAGFAADLQVHADSHWEGLADGHGHLRARRVAVQVHGRRVPRPRRGEVWFPAADGRITAVHEQATPVAATTDATATTDTAVVLEPTG